MKKRIEYILWLTCYIMLCGGCAREDEIEKAKDIFQGMSTVSQSETSPISTEYESETNEIIEDDTVDEMQKGNEENYGREEEWMNSNEFEQEGGDETERKYPIADTDSANQIAQSNSEDVIEDISDKVEIQLNTADIDKDYLNNVTVTIINNSDYDIVSSEKFTLQKRVTDGWEQIPLSLVWNDLGITIMHGQSYDFTYDLNSMNIVEENTMYRIVKNINVNQKEYELYAEFIIKE